jgi:ATP-binding cassette, subfamily B, bacterial
MGHHRYFDDADRIATAARRAGAHEYIEALPDGYLTRLGAQFMGGNELSVGQWQRLALARLFFRDAPFVILDEPSAALDARAEWALFEDIRALFRGRTVVFISHRFSNVRLADRIFVLRHGQVIEHGSHDQLIAGGGLYAELYGLQASSYSDRSA